jgi:hypothetical protein
MQPSYVTLTEFFNLGFVLLGTLDAPLWHSGSNNDKYFTSKLTTLRQVQICTSREIRCSKKVCLLFYRSTLGQNQYPFGYKYSVRPHHSSHLSLTETKTVSDTLDTNSIFTRIIARGDFIIDTLSEIALSKGPNKVSSLSAHLRTKTDPVPEALCFLVSRIPDGGQSPKTQ